MTRIILAGSVAALLAAGTWGVVAAEQRVRVSPRGTVEATVDGVRITMEYGRPSKRGREIWGGLVRWGRWWMPGADESTSITTSAPLMVGPLAVPAGTHTLYTVPGPDTFLLVINNETGQFHTVYHPDRDLGRVPMTMTTMPDVVEQMTFAVAASEGGGMLSLSWDDRAYTVLLRAAHD
jgi:hypothetical protein